MKKSLIPNLAFKALKETEQVHDEQTMVPSNIDNLRSYFDETFIQATELLEKCTIQQFSTPDGLRKIFKISSKNEYHTIFDNINFCMCQNFQMRVLDSKCQLTCKHVLAVSIAKITASINEEVISPLIYECFLNEQLHFLK